VIRRQSSVTDWGLIKHVVEGNPHLSIGVADGNITWPPGPGAVLSKPHNCP
jgi:hypothetical protein